MLFNLWVKSQEDGLDDATAEAYAVGSVSQHNLCYVRSASRKDGVSIYVAKGELEDAAAWLSEEPRTAPFPAGALLYYVFLEREEA